MVWASSNRFCFVVAIFCYMVWALSNCFCFVVFLNFVKSKKLQKAIWNFTNIMDVLSSQLFVIVLKLEDTIFYSSFDIIEHTHDEDYRDYRIGLGSFGSFHRFLKYNLQTKRFSSFSVSTFGISFAATRTIFGSKIINCTFLITLELWDASAFSEFLESKVV